MTPYEIPLSATPQQFDISLGGTTYQLTLSWNVALQSWVLDIRDASGNDILLGVPLVTGVNLLAQYPHLGFNGSLIVQTDHNPDAIPTYDNLGDTSHLFFVVQ